jgi:branched-chain amino acid transport system ATP-binding protein
MEGLRVQNVFTAYDRADVLQDVSLTVEKGTITCLLGSNGSGKTTLIRSILGLTPPRRGSILFGDKALTGLPTHRVVAQGIACIPEGRKVFPRLTVVENLHLGAYLEEDDRVIDQRLERVFAVFPRLAERRDQLAGTMSGGEQAMVSIGRGMLGAPKLLLIDEPSLGLSPLLVTENFAVIRRINEQGVTVFLVEQNVHQTLAIAHRGYVLSQGRVVAQGTAAVQLAGIELAAERVARPRRGAERHRVEVTCEAERRKPSAFPARDQAGAPGGELVHRHGVSGVLQELSRTLRARPLRALRRDGVDPDQLARQLDGVLAVLPAGAPPVPKYAARTCSSASSSAAVPWATTRP